MGEVGVTPSQAARARVAVVHFGTNRSDVAHPVTSARCRTTLDSLRVTCAACGVSIGCPPSEDDAHRAHVADAVRTWLAGLAASDHTAVNAAATTLETEFGTDDFARVGGRWIEGGSDFIAAAVAPAAVGAFLGAAGVEA